MARPWRDQGEHALDALGAPILGRLEVAGRVLGHSPAWDGRLGDEPRRLLEVRVGGVDLSAVAGGRGWERLGWQAFLFRTQKGNYFAQFQSAWPGERDRLLPLSPDVAMRLYGELAEKRVSFEEAFP